MKEIIIKKWCDMCWRDGEQRTPSIQSWTVGIQTGEGRPIPRVVETCEPHGKMIGDLLEITGDLEVLPVAGQTVAPVKSVKPASGTGHTPGGPDGTYIGARQECPVCQVDFAKSALVQHIWTQHQHQPGRPPQPTNCPDCGTPCTQGGAMVLHRRRTHDYDPVAEALQGLPGFPPAPTPVKAKASRR